MKFILTLALCASTQVLAFSQTNDLSINLGASLNVPQLRVPQLGKVYDPALAGYGNVRFMKGAKSTLMYGVQMGFTRLHGWYKRDFIDDHGNPIGGHPRNNFYFGKTSLFVDLLAGNMFSMRRNQITAGFSVGGMYNLNPSYYTYRNRSINQPMSTEKEKFGYVQDNAGFAVGTFFDYVHFFGESFGLGFTIHPKFNILFTPTGTSNIWTLPTTIGFHHKLGRKHKNK